MIRVDPTAFDPTTELKQFTAKLGTDTGGVASFIGFVRAENQGQRVHALTLDHYPGMTERQLAALEQTARSRWPLTDVLIIHRVGPMIPGDAIVLIATSSSHRQAAFDACQFLIDWLKTKAPFWKCETTDQGETWVQARTTDAEAAARWG